MTIRAITREEFLAGLASGPKTEVEIQKLPSLDLSCQVLGAPIAAGNPYIIGGWWNSIDLSGSSGHVVINGFANRLVMDDADGLCVRTYGAFASVEIRTMTETKQYTRWWLELNGHIYELDIQGYSTKQGTIWAGTHDIETGIPAWARTGRVNPCNEVLNPLTVHRIFSPDALLWQWAIDRSREQTAEQLNPLKEEIPDE